VDHVVGGGEVEARPARLEREDEDRRTVVALESGDHRVPIGLPGPAVEIEDLPPEPIPQDFQTSAAGTSRLGSSIAWSRTSRAQGRPPAVSAPSSGGTIRKQVRNPESPAAARRCHAVTVPARARTSGESGRVAALAEARASSAATSGAVRFARAALLGK